MGNRRLSLRLDMVSVDDGFDQPWKAILNLCAARGVVHLDTSPFATDQACLSERFEVLRESRFGDCPFTDIQKIRTILRALRADNIGIDCHPHGIGQSMENAFDCDVLDRRVEKRSH